MIVKRLAIGLIALSLTFTTTTFALYSNTNEAKVEQVVTPVVIASSPRQVRLTEFFRKVGSPCPERMSTAVLETTDPRLYAVITNRESNGDPNAVGDSGQSRGATQVKEKHWAHLLHEGKVSKDPVIQLQDTERIINALKKEHHGSLTAALNVYGGCTTGAYAKTILAKKEAIKRYKI